ncbi:MAG: SUMF1/EgtB/PvdO family nonheme iron enzyme [Chitinispirillaceae bacterium]|jgi:formylglycine-generating enzyme required for sulfatase activity
MRKTFFIGVAMVAAVVLWGCGSKGNPAGTKNITFPTMDTIPAGIFQMGAVDIDEVPVHSVTVSAFTMSQTLVTQEQYQAVVGSNPAYFDSGRAWPVEQVSWYDAALFCNALSKLAGLDTVYNYARDGIMDTSVMIDYTKNGYRLPTEAEYEYACRAGDDTNDYYWGRNYPPTTTADTLAIDSNAVWYLNSPNGTQQVAMKKPNAFGLYDMSGNVWEWCNDWYGSYSASSQINPTGAPGGGYRVVRGSSWSDINGYGANSLCAAYRNGYSPLDRFNVVGFRVVCGAR